MLILVPAFNGGLEGLFSSQSREVSSFYSGARVNIECRHFDVRKVRGETFRPGTSPPSVI